MLRTPAFLGFSMVRRKNRRRLVAVTYAVLLVLMATTILALPWVPHLVGRGAALLLWSYIFVMTWSIFGRLAKDMVLPQIGGGEMTSLGLTLRRRHAENDLDEREVAVRNAAYFTAYRAVAVYSFIVWFVLFLSFELSASTGRLLFVLFVISHVAMVLTLPPAVILWTEPDVPEEAGV